MLVTEDKYRSIDSFDILDKLLNICEFSASLDHTG